MPETISSDQFLIHSESVPVVDVRSPSEYKQGHIPGALNIPLFDDEERRTVGILYKQKGRREAILKGFELAGRKTAGIQKAALDIADREQLLVHCWRGGMRSGAMAWLFERSGIHCELLDGGYKSFRRYARTSLSGPFHLIVLGGMTGSGKTGILREIKNSGFQTIDLEALANHKGSAFGSLGEVPQPTNEQFENELFMSFNEADRSQPVFIEDESRNIGRNIIPPQLFSQMQNAEVIVLKMNRNLRIERLVRDYGEYPAEELIGCINKLSKRIGGQNASKAVACIEKGDLHEVAAITLYYYDKRYSFGLSRRQPDKLHIIPTDTLSEKANAGKILDYCKTKKLLQ